MGPMPGYPPADPRTPFEVERDGIVAVAEIVRRARATAYQIEAATGFGAYPTPAAADQVRAAMASWRNALMIHRACADANRQLTGSPLYRAAVDVELAALDGYLADIARRAGGLVPIAAPADMPRPVAPIASAFGPAGKTDAEFARKMAEIERIDAQRLRAAQIHSVSVARQIVSDASAAADRRARAARDVL